jgi:ribosome-associated protein
MEDLPVSPGLVIPAADLAFAASRSGGPGGQNVNKVNSKVELRFDLPHTTVLRPEVKARLRRLARLDKAGHVLIVSSVTRDQHRNLEDARQRLVELVRQALIRPKKRRRTKPTRGSKERRLAAKRRRSEKKQGRRRVDE